jgi:hypothetical protein
MSMQKAKPNPSSNGEARLVEEVKRLAGTGPESFSPEDWASLCEQLRLQALYPGQYVAWRDHFRGEGNRRRLVRREILCASPRAAVVRKELARLSDAELYGVFMDYIEGPDEPPVGR